VLDLVGAGLTSLPVVVTFALGVSQIAFAAWVKTHAWEVPGPPQLAAALIIFWCWELLCTLFVAGALCLPQATAKRSITGVVLLANLVSYGAGLKFQWANDDEDAVHPPWWSEIETGLGLTAILASIALLTLSTRRKSQP
jgi:hypothetical protein